MVYSENIESEKVLTIGSYPEYRSYDL